MKEIFAKICWQSKTPPRTRTWQCTRSTMQMSYLSASDFPFNNFCKLAQHAETKRTNVWEKSNEAYSLSIKPRLHERFLSRSGDAIFFRFCRVACVPGWLHFWQILATNWRPCESLTSRDLSTINRHTLISLAKFSLVASQAWAKSCRGGYTGKYLCNFVAKVSTMATFFCDFFTRRVASSRVATRAIFISRWRCDKVWKNASPARAKNLSCSCGLRVQTKLNHISICFLPQYQRQRNIFFFRARAEKGIARHVDASSVVWTLIDKGKLANQIGRLAAIVVKYSVPTVYFADFQFLMYCYFRN